MARRHKRDEEDEEEKPSRKGSKGGKSCKALKQALRDAPSGKARGRALGAYAKAGCARRRGRKRR